MKRNQHIKIENLSVLPQDIKHLATLLDNSFKVPGTSYRIGVDGLIGLIPGFGDITSGFLGAYIILRAARLGVSRVVLFTTVKNFSVDLLLGSVPVIGDLFDFTYKSNLKNIKLIENHLVSLQEKDSINPKAKSVKEIIFMFMIIILLLIMSLIFSIYLLAKLF